jgi:hypothetical protein
MVSKCIPQEHIFDGTSWLGGPGIAVLAVIIFAIMSVILGAVFGIVVPGSFFPHLRQLIEDNK